MNYKKIKNFKIILVFISLVLTNNVFLVQRLKARTYTKNISRGKIKVNNCTYTKKRPYQGFGKRSVVNNKIKTKSTRGHFKKTSKGVTFVNPYARSR